MTWKSANGIKNAQEAFSSSTLQSNLAYIIAAYFKIIVTAIKELGAKGEMLYSDTARNEGLQKLLKKSPENIVKNYCTTI